MGQYDSGPRRLPFAVRDPLVYSRTTEGPDECSLAPLDWPEDSDERVPVVMMMSLNEYVVLSSSIDVGSDLAYAEDAIRVLRLWMREVLCNVQICSLIIDCMLNDADTKQAMVDSLSANEQFQQLVKQTANRATQPQIEGLVVPSDCDDSIIAGRVIQLVDILDTNNVDFLQIVEVGTNDEERVSLLLAAIPGLSESPVDEILTLFQGFLEEFTENYGAAVTLSWKNEVSEELWCLAKETEDCSLTYEQVFNYFNERAGSELTIASLIQNIIQFVINGDFPTDNLIASGMYAIQLAFIVAGRDFYGLNIPTIGAVVRDALPSSAWEDWDPCGPEAERTPVIASIWDPGNVAGVLSGPTSEGVWTVTSGTRATDEAFVIRDISNREFVLVDKVYSAGPQCQVWLLGEEVEHLACGIGDQYTNETITEFWTTWFSGPHQTMQFRMVPPSP